MRMIALLFLLWSGVLLAQPYVSIGLVSLEPEVAVGYQHGPASLEVGTYGPHELSRIQRLSGAETWVADDGFRITGRWAVAVARNVDATVGASAHYATYSHSGPGGSSFEKKWTTGLLLGGRFAMPWTSERAAMRAEWMVADAPSGFESMDGLRVSIDYRF